jgi:hypothetical protein
MLDHPVSSLVDFGMEMGEFVQTLSHEDQVDLFLVDEAELFHHRSVRTMDHQAKSRRSAGDRRIRLSGEDEPGIPRLAATVTGVIVFMGIGRSIRSLNSGGRRILRPAPRRDQPQR